MNTASENIHPLVLSYPCFAERNLCSLFQCLCYRTFLQPDRSIINTVCVYTPSINIRAAREGVDIFFPLYFVARVPLGKLSTSLCFTL
jgi:hypothetical protein